MSVRAHRVRKIEYNGESFNLSFDEDLVDFLDAEDRLFDQLNEDGCGFAEISVETLERALTEVNLEPETKKAIEKDLNWAKENDQDWIRYYFF